MGHRKFGVKESLCSSRSLSVCSRGSFARRILHQSEEDYGKDTPGSSTSKGGTQLGWRLLCPQHFSLNHRPAPSTDPQHIHTSVVPASPVRAQLRVIPDIYDTQTGKGANPIPSMSSWKALSRQHTGCTCTRATLSQEDLPSQVSWVSAIPKS